MSVVDGIVKRPGFAHRKTKCRRAWAVISSCGKYRYRLGRDVGEDGATYKPGYVLWTMLNPSTADAEYDDNTILRCIGFTRAWGYQEFVVGNVYAYRSTDPKGLWKADDPVGPENQQHLIDMAIGASVIIAAWGQHAQREDAEPVADLLSRYGEVSCLGIGSNNKPKHPLMLPSSTQRSLYMPKFYKPEVA